MSEGPINPQDAVAALERFVLENAQLLRLENRIGRYNIFDAIGLISRRSR